MGAGISGNCSNTKGSAPVTRTGNVRYSQKKTEGYLLNTEHPKGGSKAKFMKDVLGYTQSDSHLYHKNVVDAITNKTPEKTPGPTWGTGWAAVAGRVAGQLRGYH